MSPPWSDANGEWTDERKGKIRTEVVRWILAGKTSVEPLPHWTDIDAQFAMGWMHGVLRHLNGDTPSQSHHLLIEDLAFIREKTAMKATI